MRAASLLFAEEFGLPRHDPAPPPPAPPPPPALTQADIAAACAEAVSTARAAWVEDAAGARLQALDRLAEAVAGTRQDAAAQAERTAEALSQAVLATLSALLPELCRHHGDAELRATLRRLLPLLARQPQLVVRVHPGLIPALEHDLAETDTLADAVQLRPANLPAGDVRVTWENGSYARDAAALQATVADCLNQLGLLSPEPTHQPGSLALAE